MVQCLSNIYFHFQALSSLIKSDVIGENKPNCLFSRIYCICAVSHALDLVEEKKISLFPPGRSFMVASGRTTSSPIRKQMKSHLVVTAAILCSALGGLDEPYSLDHGRTRWLLQ